MSFASVSLYLVIALYLITGIFQRRSYLRGLQGPAAPALELDDVIFEASRRILLGYFPQDGALLRGRHHRTPPRRRQRIASQKHRDCAARDSMPPTDLLLSQLRVRLGGGPHPRREVPAFRSFRALRVRGR